MSETYWILDPMGHRAVWQNMAEARDGEEVEIAGQKGKYHYVPPPPPDVWVCDYCSVDIKVFPVVSEGSYALCESHAAKLSEPVERVCGCKACGSIIPHIAKSLGLDDQQVGKTLMIWLDYQRRMNGSRVEFQR